jgi:dihydroneopterin aldolase
MDKITLHNMKFFGYHGCEHFEQQKGQGFEADVDIFTDMKKAGNTDCLLDAVNYAEIFEKIKLVMEKERHDLLERVAQRVAERVLEDNRVEAVIVRVRKPGVPLSGFLDWVQVEIARDRNL